MAKTPKTANALTDEQLSAKYPGSFPFPAYPENADPKTEAGKEIRSEINRVRSASFRKAHAALFDFVKGLAADIAEKGSAEVEEFTAYTKEAFDFLNTKREKAGRPASGKSNREPLETKVSNFFKDEKNHTDANGEPTPGSVNSIPVFVGLQMDPVRVKGALKRYNDGCAPADRIWVEYDSEARVYNVKGTGADAPEGWTGAVPAPTGPAALAEV